MQSFAVFAKLVRERELPCPGWLGLSPALGFAQEARAASRCADDRGDGKTVACRAGPVLSLPTEFVASRFGRSISARSGRRRVMSDERHNEDSSNASTSTIDDGLRLGGGRAGRGGG